MSSAIDEFCHAVMLVGLIAMMLLLFTTSHSDRAHRSSYAPRPSNGRSRESDDAPLHPPPPLVPVGDHVSTLPPDDPWIDARRADKLSYLGSLRSALESSVGPRRATYDRTNPSNSRVESNDAKDAPRIHPPGRSMCSTSSTCSGLTTPVHDETR